MKHLLVALAVVLSVPCLSLAETDETSRLITTGAQTIVDGSLRVFNDLRVDRWIDLFSISTPTTPSTSHSKLWYDGANKRICAIYDNAATTCFAAVAPSSGTFTEVTSTVYKSAAPIIGTTGVIRLGNNENLVWRDSVNNQNMIITANGSDQFSMDHPLVIGPASNQLILGSVGGTNFNTINSVTPAASRILSIQDPGANANFVMSQGAQTIGSTMTLTGGVTNISSTTFVGQIKVGSNLFPKARTRQVFTSGTGTYTTPAGVLYINIKLVGGGGGGQGSGTGSRGAGGTGGTSYFGTSLSSATGGSGGSDSQSIGGGGTAGSCDIGVAGGSATGSCTTTTYGSHGAYSVFGGGGSGGVVGGAGSGGQTNTGGGGGGGGAGGNIGGGGGAGGYCEKLITSPNASYVYGVGGAGTAGTAGTSGFGGGAGGTGLIIVDEFYF